MRRARHSSPRSRRSPICWGDRAAPILLTTRTARGLMSARRELGDRVIARIAPLDLPQLLRPFLRASAPWRLDIIETELWPQLILESRRRGVGVVFVSATVSGRTG